MAKSIIEGLKDWLDACPLLQGGVLNVDYLPDRPSAGGVEFSIDAQPAAVVVRQYASSSIRQYPFGLSSVVGYGEDELKNMDNSGLFEKLQLWMETESRKGNLPRLPDGQTALRAAAQTTGYLAAMEAGMGRYQIQCVLEYLQEGLI